MKMYVDGCSKGNPGSSGGGGIIRDHRGHMILAFADYFGLCSNNVAEAMAILQGLCICIDRGFLKIIVESDSLMLVNIINNKVRPPWQIHSIMAQIGQLIQKGSFLFVHIFREGNVIADQMASLGEKVRNQIAFTEDLSLPRQVRAYLKQEHDGFPKFQI
ncbi:hypothetical protein A4A49_24098 [Nicotiana attenuata]|uniref:RNase H type-1 domain-containing protein n=1 Tax=Nicotiana attenuata TaxID=49451 RepID=A0A1J6IQI2_NICAT|nr:hypothetical protein A4A49_24098 [Nicotiana attenuata]